MPRVPYRFRVDSLAPDHVAVFDRLETERRMPTPNIFRAIANAPLQLDGMLTYARALRQATELGPRLRELVIISIARAKQGAYIAVHHEQDALNAGFTAAQVAAIGSLPGEPGLFTEAEQAVIELGTAIGNDDEVTDELWDRVANHLSAQQLVQLVLTASWYASGVITSRLLGIDIEEDCKKDAE